MAAESMESTGAGAAGVDERGRPALSRHLDRFDTKRGPAPIDMCVKIDHPGHDEQPTHIDDLGAAGRQVARDFGYLSVAEGDVGRLVAPARRVDDAAASEDQIRHAHPSHKFGSATEVTIPTSENGGEGDAATVPAFRADGSQEPAAATGHYAADRSGFRRHTRPSPTRAAASFALEVSVRVPASNPEGNKRAAIPVLILPCQDGTDSSNPLSSSGESANHRFRWVFATATSST
jgi:hypothetical protein